jgi:hypothetical protein
MNCINHVEHYLPYMDLTILPHEFNEFNCMICNIKCFQIYDIDRLRSVIIESNKMKEIENSHEIINKNINGLVSCIKCKLTIQKIDTNTFYVPSSLTCNERIIRNLLK